MNLAWATSSTEKQFAIDQRDFKVSACCTQTLQKAYSTLLGQIQSFIPIIRAVIKDHTKKKAQLFCMGELV